MNARPEQIFHTLQAGRLEQAREQAQALRQEQPHDAAGWHLEALAELSAGRAERALELAREAARLDPGNADVHNTLGAALLTLGRLDEALAALQKAIALEPHHAPAYANLAAAHLNAGRERAAWEAYRILLELDPRHPRALETLPRLTATLAQAALQEGRTAQAAALLDPMLARLPRDEALALANLWLAHGQPAQAEAAFAALLRRFPDDPDLLNNLAVTHMEQGRPEQARPLLEALVARHPERYGAYTNLCHCLCDDGDPEAAEAIVRQAIEQHPERPEGYINLATALFRQNRYAEAEAVARRALELAPQDPVAWNNLGNALHGLGRHREAIAHLDRALELKPDYHDARYTRGMIRLLIGDFDDAWGDYFYRPRHHHVPEGLTPITPGADHRGRHVLLTRAQGLGDELFFLRWAERLRAQGARITYRAGGKLLDLLRRHGIADAVIDEDSTVPDADAVYAVDDLPLLLGPGDLPPPLPLRPREDRLESLGETLQRLGPPPYLVLAWRGGRPELNRGRYRFLDKQVPLEVLAEMARPWPGTYLSIQREPRPGERERLAERLGRPVHDLSHVNDDLEDALALLALVDEYLGVSNTNVHLRAGLGKGGQILVPHPPEWRWMAEGGHSPWFPGFHVHRQGADGDWAPARASLERTWTP